MTRTVNDQQPDATARSGFPSPLLALEFLTVLRLRRPAVASTEQFARALLWYPAVGLLIGLVAAGFDRLLRPRLPALTEAVLLLLLLEGLTGLLHLDGLADCADGLLGLHERARRLEIMRDSRVGAFGVAAIGFYLLLAVSALAGLHGPARTATLAGTPALGRAAMVVAAALFPNARSGGLATGFHAAARGWPGALALASAVAIALLVWGWGGVALAGVALVAAAATAGLAARRLGGVTGDVFGASCEIAQVAVLTCAGAWQGVAWLRPWW